MNFLAINAKPGIQCNIANLDMQNNVATQGRMQNNVVTLGFIAK